MGWWGVPTTPPSRQTQENTLKKKASEYVQWDIDSLRREREKRLSDRKYRSLLNRVTQAEKERDAVKSIREVSTFTIHPQTSNNSSEATAVVLASDWHYEEQVKSSDVNGLNEFNLEIADKRVQQFFGATCRMLEVFSKDIKIPHVVLGLLGDFINGDIHEEMLETNQLTPIEAVIRVQNLIASGIEMILKKYTGNIVVVCVSGN